MRIVRTGSTLILAVVLGLAVAACEQEKPKGPAERLGEKIDSAAGDVKAAAEEAKEDVKEAAEEAEEEIKH